MQCSARRVKLREVRAAEEGPRTVKVPPGSRMYAEGANRVRYFWAGGCGANLGPQEQEAFIADGRAMIEGLVGDVPAEAEAWLGEVAPRFYRTQEGTFCPVASEEAAIFGDGFRRMVASLVKALAGKVLAA